MPLQRSTTVISNNITLTAGGGTTTTSSVDCTTGATKTVYIILTNGATGPAVAASAKVQASADNSNWYDFSTYTGGVGNNQVVSYCFNVPLAFAYIRIIWTAGSTGSSITARAELTQVAERSESLTDSLNNLIHVGDNTYTSARMFTPNLESGPVALFDQTVNQAGVSQQNKLFPNTIAITGGLPTIASGTVATLTNSSNVCGAVFSPHPAWGAVMLDIASVGATSGKTLTIEIGRLAASGALTQVLASVTYTTGSSTIGATTTNILTGAGGHSSVTWRLFDTTVITTYNSLGTVIQGISGSSGNGSSQLVLNCNNIPYYYVVITALDASFSEILSVITPTTFPGQVNGIASVMAQGFFGGV